MLGRYSPRSHGVDELRGLEAMTLDGRKILGVSPEDLLIYLCLHGSNDCWQNLESICSVAELVNSHPTLDWIWVINKAEAVRCVRMLLLGCFMATDLFDIELPELVSTRIEADFMVSKIAGETYARLFPDDSESSLKDFDPSFSSFQLKIRNLLEEKVRYCLALVFRPTREDWRRLPFPSAMSFLHYLFRPIRLAYEFGQYLLGYFE